MGLAEDIARLILEAQTKGFPEAKKQVASVKTEVYDLADAYELVEQTQETYVAATRKGATAQSEAAANAAKYAAALESLRSTVAKTTDAVTQQATAVNKTGTAAMSAARGLVDVSRGLEDLSTGGFIGILNNIPGMFTNFASAAGVAGATLGTMTAGVSLAATGAYVLYKNWDMVTGLYETRNPFPQAAHDIDGLREALKKAKDEMEELGKKSVGTEAQISRYNELRGQTRDLEKQISDEMERQKDLEKLRKLDPEKETTDARAKALQKSIVGEFGNSDDLINSVEKALKVTLFKERGTLAEAAINSSPDDPNRQVLNEKAFRITGRLNDPEKLRKDAEDLVRNAVEHGQVGAFGEIRGLMQKAPEKFIPEQQKAFDRAVTVETKEQKAEREKNAREKEQENAKKLKEIADRQAANVVNAGKDAKQALGDADSVLNHLNRLGVGLGKAGARAEARAKTKEEAEADRVVERNTADATRNIGERAKGMTGIEARAENALAGQIASGKVRTDASGQLSEADFAQLVAAIRQQIMRENPGANPLQAGALANRVAGNAESDVGGMLAAQMGQGLSLTQAAANVSEQTLATIMQMDNKMRGLEAQLGRLQQGNQQVRRQIRQPGNWNGNPMGGD